MSNFVINTSLAPVSIRRAFAAGAAALLGLPRLLGAEEAPAAKTKGSDLAKPEFKAITSFNEALDYCEHVIHSSYPKNDNDSIYNRHSELKFVRNVRGVLFLNKEIPELREVIKEIEAQIIRIVNESKKSSEEAHQTKQALDPESSKKRKKQIWKKIY